ncbi:polyketide synthase [Fusarium pseudocircinatum]|uniref:Polyketide synthase n=1 Tax=Fusarium pseudocircinatum TaxID=56676 RepID=A0A8H5PFZ9_9HYPO|nr:polyketide synthase [Fusarium pseudocircinatum]
MTIVEINTVLDPAAKLAVMVKETLRALPPRPSDEVRMKHRWYQCIVQNATQFEIRFDDSYFNAGKYLAAPQSIGPYGQMTQDEGHRFYFAIGLDAPAMGGFKAGVVESDSAKTGLEIVSREGNSITSTDQFRGKDNDEDGQVIQFHLVAYPGRDMKVIITQRIVDRDDE